MPCLIHRNVLRLQFQALSLRDIPSAETLTPRNTASDRKFYTFFPWRCAAFSRARNRRRIPFLSPAFPVLPRSPSFRQPQRQSRPDVFGVQREQSHLRADLAMVAALG